MLVKRGFFIREKHAVTRTVISRRLHSHSHVRCRGALGSTTFSAKIMDNIPSIEQELFELHIGITTAANNFHRCITDCETFSPLILSTYLPAISFRTLGLPSMTNFDAIRVRVT